jgi:hypothetical protein
VEEARQRSEGAGRGGADKRELLKRRLLLCFLRVRLKRVFLLGLGNRHWNPTGLWLPDLQFHRHQKCGRVDHLLNHDDLYQQHDTGLQYPAWANYFGRIIGGTVRRHSVFTVNE